jgi:hypothetical protein
MVKAGKKIQAIKLVRNAKGLGLAEAKTYVDRLEPAGVSTDKKAVAGCVRIGCLTIIGLFILFAVIGHSSNTSTSRNTSSSRPDDARDVGGYRVGDTVALRGLENNQTVVVWKSFAHQREATALAEGGAPQVLLLPHVACLVREDAWALVREKSFISPSQTAPAITIVDGPRLGCQGIVHPGNVGVVVRHADNS